MRDNLTAPLERIDSYANDVTRPDESVVDGASRREFQFARDIPLSVRVFAGERNSRQC